MLLVNHVEVRRVSCRTEACIKSLQDICSLQKQKADQLPSDKGQDSPLRPET